VDQFLQSAKSIVGTDHQMRTDLIQAPPLQGAGSGSIVGTDPLFTTSKKFPIDEDVKKDSLRFSGKLAGAGFYKIGARALLKCPKQNFRQKVAPGMPDASDLGGNSQGFSLRPFHRGNTSYRQVIAILPIQLCSQLKLQGTRHK
jgi:hypothetical protein